MIFRLPLFILAILLLLTGCIQQPAQMTPSEVGTFTPPSSSGSTSNITTTLPNNRASPTPPSKVFSSATPTLPIPLQTTGLDIVRDVLGVLYLAPGYDIENVLPSAFGLSKQLALLPNGDILITDLSFKRILLLSNSNLSLVAGPDETSGTSVAAMPDGQACYVNLKNQLISIELRTGNKRIFGVIPQEERVQALAADSEGNVFAVTRNNRLYRFTKEGERSITTSALPFEQTNTPTISDIDVSSDGTVYISGFRYFVSVTIEGSVKTITDDINYEPSWCEVAPDNKVYVKDGPSGIRRLETATGKLIPIPITLDSFTGDFLAISADEFLILCSGNDAICRYNFTTRATVPLFVNSVNSRAFTASNEVFLATPYIAASLKSHILSIRGDGTTKNINSLNFSRIESVDIDRQNRLCLFADGSFHRLEPDESIISVTPVFPTGWKKGGNTNIAIGADGLYYCISTDFNDSIRVWAVNEQGKVTVLPITFSRASFGNAFQVADARIDTTIDGKLVMVVSAIGSKGQGPYYQRVYRSNADGTNLMEVANLDSKRIGGMVDVAIDQDKNIFVLALQSETTGSGEAIYRIGNTTGISKFLEIRGGRDPKSIDVDSNGNVWLCTTIGLFRISG